MIDAPLPRLLFLAVLTGFLGGCDTALPPGTVGGQLREVGPFRPLFDIEPAAASDLVKNKPGIVIIDLRTPQEYAAGHIPGAVNHEFIYVETPLGDPPPEVGSRFAQENLMDLLDKNQPYLLYGTMWKEDKERLLLPPPADPTIVVEKYTRPSDSSDYAAYLMMADNALFLEIHQIIGGYEAWVDAGLPVETGDGTKPAPAPKSPPGSPAPSPKAVPEAPPPASTAAPTPPAPAPPASGMPSTSFDLPSFTLPGVRRPASNP